MANPQREKGHVDIANEIVDKLCQFRVSGQKWQIIWVVLRKTWGWVVTDKNGNYKKDISGNILKKKMAWITTTEFSRLTGMPRSKCYKLAESLVSEKILKKSVTHKGNKKLIYYGFNKNYEEWKMLPKKVMFPIKVTSTFPIKVTIKEKKENIHSEKFQEFTSHWNSKDFLRTLQDKETQEKKDTRIEFNRILKKGFSFDEILEAVDNYNVVLSDPDKFYFSYKWPPSDFLKKGLKKFLSVNSPLDNFLKKEFKQTKQSTAPETSEELEEIYKREGFK